MNALNSLLTRLADMLFVPFAAWPGIWTLCLFSAVIGVLMAWVFRLTSNQRALKSVADRIRAQLFAIKLFKDDLGVAFRCQVELMKATGLRLWYSLPPMLVMLVPLVLVLVQLAMRYEHRPLAPGESAIVELQISPEGWESFQKASIEAPEGIAVETPALRDATRYTVFWRVRANGPVEGTVRFTVGHQIVEKSITAGDKSSRVLVVSEVRPGPGFFEKLLHPVEPGFDHESPVESIRVGYPERSTPVFGWDVPWWLTFFLVSMLAAVVARPWLKVQF